MKQTSSYILEGQKDYIEWQKSLVNTPEKMKRYKKIAAENGAWLKLNSKFL